MLLCYFVTMLLLLRELIILFIIFPQRIYWIADDLLPLKGGLSSSKRPFFFL